VYVHVDSSCVYVHVHVPMTSLPCGMADVMWHGRRYGILLHDVSDVMYGPPPWGMHGVLLAEFQAE
jgi:hypothetical protein